MESGSGEEAEGGEEMIVLLLLGIVAVLIIWPCMIVSGWCSREEERRQRDESNYI